MRTNLYIAIEKSRISLPKEKILKEEQYNNCQAYAVDFNRQHHQREHGDESKEKERVQARRKGDKRRNPLKSP